jgi:amino acid permease
MKKILILILVICMGLIIYFFIKEPVKGIALSHKENMILSVTYLITGISILVLGRIKFLENKKR